MHDGGDSEYLVCINILHVVANRLTIVYKPFINSYLCFKLHFIKAMHFPLKTLYIYMLNKNSLVIKKCEANQKPQWL